MSGGEPDGTKPNGSLERRDVLKGIAGAGAFAAGVSGVDRVRGSDGDRPGRYVVGIDPGSSVATDAHSAATTRAVSVHREIDLGSVRTVVAGWYSPDQRQQLRAHAGVAYVEPEQFLEPLSTDGDPTPDSHGQYPWGIERIGADSAHDQGYTGAGTDIVVVDTGIPPSHYALDDVVGTGKSFGDAGCVEEDRLFETVTCEQPWDDDHYHGTHVAGTAGAADVDVGPAVDPANVFVADTTDNPAVTGQRIRDDDLGVEANVVTGDGTNVVVNDGNVETEGGTTVESETGENVIVSDGTVVADGGDIQYVVERDGETIVTYTDDGSTQVNVRTAGGADVVPGSVPDGAVERIAGVAPDATIHAANVFEWTDQGGEWVVLAPSSNVAAAIQWAADQGYDVVNASLGGPSPSSAIQDALAYATDQHNVVFVASAGNDGNACDEDPYNGDPDDCVSYPAAFDDAIAVANATDSDDIASSSSRGPEVELAAPGTGVFSTAPGHVETEVSSVDLPFWKLSGTSMAAPHVAGLAALIKAHTDLQDNTDIRTRLRETAEDIGAREVESGNGLIDVLSALDGPTEPPSVSTLDPSSVDRTEALLEGDLGSLGDASEADVFFEYWEDGSSDQLATPSLTRSSPGTWGTSIDGLDPGTTYRYRAVVESEAGSDTGSEATFTTDQPPLSVATGEPVDVGQSGATLRGEVTDMGGAESVDASFEYWVDGSGDPVETAAETLTEPDTFELTVADLDPETTYRYRALAASDSDSDSGAEATFTTASPPLSVVTGEASAVERRSVTLSGDLPELGAADQAEVYFEYWIAGDPDPEETDRESVTEPRGFEQQVTGLDPGTTYTFRAAAETSAASATGSERSFTTEHLPLTVETGGATDVTQTAGTVSGDLTQLGAADSANVFFEFGPEAGDDREETTRTLVAEPSTVEERLAGLRQDTTYSYRSRAESETESARGGTDSFTTALEPVSRPTVDTTAAADATFSRWGEGYRIRAAGRGPWYRPRNEHGYAAIYADADGDVVVQTTVEGLRGDSDTRMAGLVASTDLSAGGGVAGDLLLAYEPEAGITLASYDDDRFEYVTAATSAPVDYPCDLRLLRRDDTFVAEFRHASETAWRSLGSVTAPGATTRQFGIFATGGSDSERCVADFGGLQVGETRVSLDPATRTSRPGRQSSFDLVVENAHSGISSYSVTLEASDPNLLSVEDVSVTGDPATTSIDSRPDGSRVEIEAGMGSDAHAAGTVTIAEVTVQAQAAGEASVPVAEAVVVGAQDAVPYDVTETNGATVTIGEDTGPPPVVGADPPLDPDGDGLYEDVDGDGSVTVSDVRALFRHRYDDPVVQNAQYFDFADSSPPEVSLLDVQALLGTLAETERDGNSRNADRRSDGDAAAADALRSLLE